MITQLAPVIAMIYRRRIITINPDTPSRHRRRIPLRLRRLLLRKP